MYKSGIHCCYQSSDHRLKKNVKLKKNKSEKKPSPTEDATTIRNKLKQNVVRKGIVPEIVILFDIRREILFQEMDLT